ncbi:MAG: hypothetical protein M3O70_20380 [Actinomycetota bacterium]|nr:hypothetical protein [Actinomycetota bacterium]
MKIADAEALGGYVARRALPRSRPRMRLAGVMLAIAAGAAVVLHVVAFDRFPTPWVDEAHFLVPALRLARHATLTVPELNAPDGLFWVPDGYYAVLAAAFALLPDTLTVARTTSLLFTLGTLAAFTAIARGLDVPPFAGAVVAAAWLLAPHVVIAGNNARMEALVILIASAAAALLAFGWGVAAVATAALAPVVHPAGLVVVAVVLAAAAVGRLDLRPRGVASWLGVGLAAGVIALESIHVLTHWGIAVDDLAFQFARKRNNNPMLFDLERAPFLLPAAGGVVLLWRSRGRLGDRGPVLAALVGLALGFGAVQGGGQEMWYGVYAEPTALALLILAALGALSLGDAPNAGIGATRATRSASGLVVLIPALAAAVWWANPPVQGFGLTDVPRGEWSAYVEGALGALERLDAGLQRPAVVAVDRLSPLTPALVVHRWKHLEFVQETPVSPIRGPTDALGRPIDYWLTTPARLKTLRLVHRVPAPPGASSPAVAYSSSHGNFELRVYAVPTASTHATGAAAVSTVPDLD